MSARITPTVGRKVHAYTTGQQIEPWDATIVKVWGKDPDSAVNLHVKDPHSNAVYFWASVMLGDESATGGHYRWMDYQQKQADKEAAARQEGSPT